VSGANYEARNDIAAQNKRYYKRRLSVWQMTIKADLLNFQEE
jgi:hypothetical protein